jgi:diguanylate cyclase (GGDEF)-like protein
MRLLVKILLPALLLSFSARGWALDPAKAFSQYLQLNWSYQAGLSPKTVNAIAQTTDGFLWLATEEGLVRYDGKSFVTFDERNSPTLGDRLIRSLAPVADGSMWIGTMTGLVLYHKGTFTSYRQQSNFMEDIYDLAVTADGVWFSSSRGLMRFNPGDQDSGRQGASRRVFTTADGLPSNGITGLAPAQDGGLWIGTRAGLARFTNHRFESYRTPASAGGKGNVIVAVAPGRRQDLWIGKEDGSIDHWSNGHIHPVWRGASTNESSIVSLHEDSDGTLWIAFRKLGLGRLREGKLELLNRTDGLPSINPDWLFEDRERNLWIGWADAGLSMVRDSKFTVFGKAEGFPSDVISSVIESHDRRLIIGTEDAGLLSISVRGEHSSAADLHAAISRVPGASSSGVMALLEQRDGTLWVGSDRGSVIRIAHGHSTVFHVPGSLTPGLPAMVEDADGNPWFGFDMPNGLARLRNGTFEFEKIPGAVKALSIAPDGSLWIASYLGGLIHLKDGTFRTYTQKDGLSNLFLTSVYVDRAGTVWAGTYLGGLNRLSAGRITHYSEEQGLSDSTVGAMIADDQGALWLAGTHGITRVRLKELADYATGARGKIETQTFGYSDGLRSEECNFKAHPAILKDQTGKLWFATLSGLARIDPVRLRTDSQFLQPLVEDIFADGHPIAPSASGYLVRSDESNLSIRFTAATFIAPEQMQLRYRLLGLEEEWLQGGSSRVANYAHLPPRHYRFEVRATDAKGNIHGQLASIDFEVLPQFYETGWFRLSLVSAAIVAIWLGIKLRMRYRVRNNERLEKLILEKTAEVRSALDSAEQARDLMRDQAMRDFLTGIWNRRAIFDILEREIDRSEREGIPLTIVMADIDHFKNINDTWGHQVGDQVIREVSLRIRQGIRANDAVGRYGGEEMLILLPGCSMEQSIARAESLRLAISSSPVSVGGFNVPISCSFGVAHIQPGATSGQIVGQADAALYLAKRDGRNCVRRGEHLPV